MRSSDGTRFFYDCDGYTAYGDNDTFEFTGVDKPDAADPTRQPYNAYRFDAKPWSQSSGTYDMGFRDYDPWLNTFTTRDMYNGALADMNLAADPLTGYRYAFASGNLTTNIELDGHRVVGDDGFSDTPKAIDDYQQSHVDARDGNTVPRGNFTTPVSEVNLKGVPVSRIVVFSMVCRRQPGPGQARRPAQTRRRTWILVTTCRPSMDRPQPSSSGTRGPSSSAPANRTEHGAIPGPGHDTDHLTVVRHFIDDHAESPEHTVGARELTSWMQRQPCLSPIVTTGCDTEPLV